MPDGCNNNAFGPCSEAEGNNTTAGGPASHAEGELTITFGEASHAEGYQTTAIGVTAHSEGYQTIAEANGSHAEGELTKASGEASHAEGFQTIASGNGSHAEGVGTRASGFASHAEGGSNNVEFFPGPIASGDFSHAEGIFTQATGSAAHAEGETTTASGVSSHAEGSATKATGFTAHAEGSFTTASAFAAHAEGSSTEASGNSSHAQGSNTRADAAQSHAEGFFTATNGLQGVHVMGRDGQPNPAGGDLPFSWYLMNGPSQYSTAGVVAKIQSNGTACFDSTVTTAGVITSAGACDFAEMFESSNGELIDVGYFVTFASGSEKIRKATASDSYILGVTSSNPGYLADVEDPACGKFLLDEWNRKQYEDVFFPAVTDQDGRILAPERTERRPVINPFWEPEKPCRSRMDRPEWAAVGLIGKLLVRDDGTCFVGGYCLPSDGGIATNTESGYWVMRRTGPNQILILFR
ncbi:peptidase G2 autoproteolytic cleavage domain-containing protein [Brevibacillus sp. SYSU BS000544]|uniref:peptidase G2 autoproteolytic cleavage domain-containing protein n=1 Tax=Brevibacillus sp. SYSU BS000544 TaxID=3416443 RepID=UPI003CE46218